MLKAKIYELEPHFATYKDNIADQAAAKELIQLAWSELDHEAIRKLLLSIPRRLSAVRKARGWYSHYWNRINSNLNAYLGFFIAIKLAEIENLEDGGVDEGYGVWRLH